MKLILDQSSIRDEDGNIMPDRVWYSFSLIVEGDEDLIVFSTVAKVSSMDRVAEIEKRLSAALGIEKGGE